MKFRFCRGILDISGQELLRIRAGIPSGPVAFDGSKIDKQCLTSLRDSVISEISIFILMGYICKLRALSCLDDVNTEQK